MIKLAISGKMRSGKTTLANYLAQELNAERIYAFADDVKNVAHLIFGVNKEGHENGREILQTVGDVGRLVDEKYWAKNLMNKIKGKNIVIIDDLRYKSEADVLKENGFDLIRISRSKQLKDKVSSENHKSEIDLDDYDNFDFYVDNSTSLENLRMKAKQIIKDLKAEGWRKENEAKL